MNFIGYDEKDKTCKSSTLRVMKLDFQVRKSHENASLASLFKEGLAFLFYLKRNVRLENFSR